MLTKLKAGITSAGLTAALTLSLVAAPAFAQSPTGTPAATATGAASASPTATPSTRASFRVVHASPDAPAVDVYMDDKRLLSSVTYRRVTSYLSTSSGRHTIKIYPTSARGQGTALVTQDLDLNANWDYTLAVVGQQANLQARLLSDNLNVPGPGKTNVRVYHFSPNAPAVKVAVRGGETIIPNLAFPNATDYLQVDSKTYNFDVQSATNSQTIASINNVTLPSNSVESVFVFGLANGQPPVSTLTTIDRRGANTPATGANDSFGFMFLIATMVAGTGLALKKIALISERN